MHVIHLVSCERKIGAGGGNRLHGLLPAPFLLSYSVFDFDFFIIFRFWAVRRLSWPSRQLLSARKSTVSYRIVTDELGCLWKMMMELVHVRVTAVSGVGGGAYADGAQLRQLQLYRHEMQHFVRALHEYIANEVVTVSWHEFKADLSRHLAGVDDLHQRHLTYLHKCRFRSELCDVHCKEADIMSSASLGKSFIKVDSSAKGQ